MPMTGEQVLQVLETLDQAGVRAWLDGGWGVDALLGEQTRDHDDLDLVVPWEGVDSSIRALAEHGYRMFDDQLPCSFVLGIGAVSERGSEDWTIAPRVDVHPVRFDADGGGLQDQPGGVPWRYPPEGFLGTGTIAGRAVACLTAEVQVLCHDGYVLDSDDKADMRRLQERFGVELLPCQRG